MYVRQNSDLAFWCELLGCTMSARVVNLHLQIIGLVASVTSVITSMHSFQPLQHPGSQLHNWRVQPLDDDSASVQLSHQTTQQYPVKLCPGLLVSASLSHHFAMILAFACTSNAMILAAE